MPLLAALVVGSITALPAALAAAEPVPLSADFYRALTTRAAPAQAADLRRGLRANLVSQAGEGWDTECEADQAATGALPGLQRLRLRDGTWLLTLACSQGAYQGSFWAVHLWRAGGRPQAVVLVWPVPKSATASTDERVLAGDVVVLKTGAVDVLTRFRGVGDCGTRTRYALRDGRVHTLQVAAVFDCADTAGAAGPEQWPVLRRTPP
jgi:hypothetical protein